jgi:hypothetical protein
MKKKFLISILVTAYVLVGCGSPQQASTYIAPQQINEPTIAEITPIFETQIERVNNCDGTNPTYNIGYKTIQAQKASFEVSVGAGGLATGTPIPAVLEVQLEAKITAALAKDYGLTTERNHDLTLDNVQGTFVEHTITWKVTRVKGLIEVVYGDGIAQVGFEKVANVELYDRTSKPLGCDGQSVDLSTPEINITPTPLTSVQTEPSSGGGGGCASIPANAQDGVEVQLESSKWYMIEEYDNQTNPPMHVFRAQLGTISVIANATDGFRAWECPTESEAFLQAQLTALGYKRSNPPHKVIGPDGQEVE